MNTTPPTSDPGLLYREGQNPVPSLTPVGPPPSLPKPQISTSTAKRSFLRGFLTPIFKFPVSADIDGLLGGFLASGLCIQKFRSRRLDFDY
jgi:hypothetical protein